MSLRVQLHSTVSRQPRLAVDGSYEIFSAEEKFLIPGILTPIATEISLAAPVGLYMHITSGSTLLQYRIRVEYTSLNEQDRTLLGGEPRPTKLIIWCINNGAAPHLIKRDDEIARMHLLSEKQIQVQPVEDIQAAEPLQLSTDKPPKAKTMIKTANTWFKTMYRDNPIETAKKYLTADQMTQIQEFHNDTIYQAARNKLVVEASFAYDILLDEQRKQIREEFLAIKNKTLPQIDSELPTAHLPLQPTISPPINIPQNTHNAQNLEHEAFSGYTLIQPTT